MVDLLKDHDTVALELCKLPANRGTGALENSFKTVPLELCVCRARACHSTCTCTHVYMCARVRVCVRVRCAYTCTGMYIVRTMYVHMYYVPCMYYVPQ